VRAYTREPILTFRRARASTGLDVGGLQCQLIWHTVLSSEGNYSAVASSDRAEGRPRYKAASQIGRSVRTTMHCTQSSLDHGTLSGCIAVPSKILRPLLLGGHDIRHHHKSLYEVQHFSNLFSAARGHRKSFKPD
jgi:hypothetical protein